MRKLLQSFKSQRLNSNGGYVVLLVMFFLALLGEIVLIQSDLINHSAKFSATQKFDDQVEFFQRDMATFLSNGDNCKELMDATPGPVPAPTLLPMSSDMTLTQIPKVGSTVAPIVGPSVPYGSLINTSITLSKMVATPDPNVFESKLSVAFQRNSQIIGPESKVVTFPLVIFADPTNHFETCVIKGHTLDLCGKLGGTFVNGVCNFTSGFRCPVSAPFVTGYNIDGTPKCMRLNPTAYACPANQLVYDIEPDGKPKCQGEAPGPVPPPPPPPPPAPPFPKVYTNLTGLPNGLPAALPYAGQYLSTYDDFRHGPLDVCNLAGYPGATGAYNCIPGGGRCRHNGNWQMSCSGQQWCTGGQVIEWVECIP